MAPTMCRIAAPLLLSAVLSCKSTGGSTGDASTTLNTTPQGTPGTAAVGIPAFAFYQGKYENNQLRFYEVDPTTRRPRVEVVNGAPTPKYSGLQRSASSAFGSSQSIANDQFGPALTENLFATYSWSTTPQTLWKCGNAEEMVTGQPSSAAYANEDCYVELNTAANFEFAVTIVRLGTTGGLRSWTNPRAPALLQAGTFALAENAPIARYLRLGAFQRDPAQFPDRSFLAKMVNAGVDAQPVVDGLKKDQGKFQAARGGRTFLDCLQPGANRQCSRPERDFLSCLKNPRTAAWTDLMAHYYCMLPYSPHRECYSTALVRTAEANGMKDAQRAALRAANPGVADAQIPAMAQIPSNEDVFGKAWNSCFETATQPDMAWIRAEQKDIYRYIMEQSQGRIDFNIESENAAINQFYGVTNPNPADAANDLWKRPRRIVDTFPGWLPDQPRYNEIRCAQRATQTRFGIAPQDPSGPCP